MRGLLALVLMAVVLIGCGTSGRVTPRDPSEDFVGIWPIVICPDGDPGFPSMKVGYTQYYMCI